MEPVRFFLEYTSYIGCVFLSDIQLKTQCAAYNAIQTMPFQLKLSLQSHWLHNVVQYYSFKCIMTFLLGPCLSQFVYFYSHDINLYLFIFILLNLVLMYMFTFCPAHDFVSVMQFYPDLLLFFQCTSGLQYTTEHYLIYILCILQKIDSSWIRRWR